MCYGRGSEMIRSQDMIGVPIVLNMNSKSTHQTFLGGCCSICAMLLILIVFTAMMLEVFVNLNYDEKATISYLRYSDGHEPF